MFIFDTSVDNIFNTLIHIFNISVDNIFDTPIHIFDTFIYIFDTLVKIFNIPLKGEICFKYEIVSYECVPFSKHALHTLNLALYCISCTNLY